MGCEALESQVRWVLDSLSASDVSNEEIAARFTDRFLGNVPPAQVSRVFASLRAAGTPAVESVSEQGQNELTLVLNYSGGRQRMRLRIEPDEPNRIDGLLFHSDRFIPDILDNGRSGGSLDEITSRHFVPFVELLIAGGVIVAVATPKHEALVSFGDAPTDGIYEIGSITKVFTGIVLADMVGRGELSLTSRLQDFVHSSVTVPRDDDREITLLNLATHTSGLPRVGPNMRRRDPNNPYADYTVEDMLQGLSETTLLFPIGSRDLYSNYGYGLLGHALCAAAETDYEALVRTKVCEPLGMSETYERLPRSLEARRVPGYDQDGNVTSHWDLPSMPGAGALQSSAGDMLRFARANLNPGGTSLGPALEAAQELRVAGGQDQHIGLGWNVYDLSNQSRVFAKTGGTGGFRCVLALHPATQSAVFAVTNGSNAHPEIAGLRLLADLIVQV